MVAECIPYQRRISEYIHLFKKPDCPVVIAFDSSHLPTQNLVTLKWSKLFPRASQGGNILRFRKSPQMKAGASAFSLCPHGTGASWSGAMAAPAAVPRCHEHSALLCPGDVI